MVWLKDSPMVQKSSPSRRGAFSGSMSNVGVGEKKIAYLNIFVAKKLSIAHSSVTIKATKPKGTEVILCLTIILSKNCSD